MYWNLNENVLLLSLFVCGEGTGLPGYDTATFCGTILGHETIIYHNKIYSFLFYISDIFKPIRPYGAFLAVIMTYVASSFLHVSNYRIFRRYGFFFGLMGRVPYNYDVRWWKKGCYTGLHCYNGAWMKKFLSDSIINKLLIFLLILSDHDVWDYIPFYQFFGTTFFTINLFGLLFSLLFIHSQGLNFQLAAVLLSLGFYSYTEFGENFIVSEKWKIMIQG